MFCFDSAIFANLKLITLCGIIGIWAKNNSGKQEIYCLEEALYKLNHRGPDYQAYKLYSNFGFGHTRLSIIDTDSRSNQPFLSADGRYGLVFNGEIYNYRELKSNLEANGEFFTTESDTEVLFKLLIIHGKAALDLLDGFFAFAFYDHHTETVILARDRMGIKPLLVYEDESKLIFSSEMHALFGFSIDKTRDDKGLNQYFGLTYTVSPNTVLKGVRALNPGECAEIKHGQISVESYYHINLTETKLNYEAAQNELCRLITQSVTNRMVADVPLGCFLSGGLDSSIIAALAVQQNPALRTFSIGFDMPYFDESDYAADLAKHIGSNHTNYVLTKDDFKAEFHYFLNTISEPFADSSAFAVYLLAKRTKKEVTVALSGDGADELFGGYRKHAAEYRLGNMGSLKLLTLKMGAKILKPFRVNRSDKWGEMNRKLQKLALGANQTFSERYWTWCQFISEKDRKRLLKHDFEIQKNPINTIDWQNLNHMLSADQQMVLPNDMLKKVDLMSMASALEVRTPFLDHKVVEFANSLPFSFKINANGGKQILKDAFADLLPERILNRAKKGFEIPIKAWLSEDIEAIFLGDLFSRAFIEHQDIFNYGFIEELQKDWVKPHFGDRIYLVWALVVFQNWWKRHYASF